MERTEAPGKALEKLASISGLPVDCQDFAIHLDNNDPLREFRKRFFYPKRGGLPIDVQGDLTDEEKEEECIYMCGNSLGLMPLSAKLYQDDIMMKWANLGVFTHTTGKLGAAFCDQPGKAMTAKIVGAESEDEIVIMNGLTVNLLLFLASFYRPEKNGRYKLMYEHHAFPSDRYNLRSVVEMAGLDPDDALIEVKPRPGEQLLRTEDILEAIHQNQDTLACLLFSGLHYYTGQKFDIPAITRAAQAAGAYVGWDLAHAIGNIELKLHDWNVDFAVWCTYKYLNSGPGGIGGAFLHSRYKDHQPLHYHGWWGNRAETRFEMRERIDLSVGADSYRLCNPPPFLACLNYASLEIFNEAGMDRILQKQYLLTGYLEYLLLKNFSSKDPIKVELITPGDHRWRGSQLSLTFNTDVGIVHKQIQALGVVCDVRRPNGMRIAPAPLYNSFLDIWKFVQVLRKVVQTKN